MFETWDENQRRRKRRQKWIADKSQQADFQRRSIRKSNPGMYWFLTIILYTGYSVAALVALGYLAIMLLYVVHVILNP